MTNTSVPKFDFFKNHDGKIRYSIFMNNEKLEGFYLRKALKAFGDESQAPEERRQLFNEAETDAFARWAEKNSIPLKSELLPSEVRTALEKRGHTILDIQNMSATAIALEVFNWHGSPGWGETYLNWCNAIQSASDWQSMDTAPKDGQTILLFGVNKDAQHKKETVPGSFNLQTGKWDFYSHGEEIIPRLWRFFPVPSEPHYKQRKENSYEQL